MSPSTPAIPPINESKMKLYEMFAQKQIAPPPNLSHPGVVASSSSSSSSNTVFNFPGFQPSNDLFTTKVEQMLIELDRLLKQSGNLPFSLLPPHHDIILVMRQIPLLINQSAQPTLLRSVVENVIYQLYQSNTGLAVEVYCRFLQTLLELSPSISKETLSWLLYSEDERKNDVWVITSLVKYGLIPLEEFDVKLSKQLNHNPTEQHIEFVTEILQNCLLTMNPITSVEEHVLVVNALMKLESPKAVELIQDLENRSNQLYKHLNPKNDSFSLRLLFAEWIRVCRINTTTNTLYKQFAQRILSQVSSSTDRLCFFFRLSTETCIELYPPARPQAIDAYTKLIGYMVRLQENNMARIKMISHVLSVIVLVIAHQHENQSIHFNQKPFLKLLSSLFIELNNATNRDKHAHAGFITVYSNVLYTLEPSQFPGFAFSWLQLFSHRLYLPLLFATDQEEASQKGQTICFKLISAHLSFLNQLLQQRSSRRFTQSEKAFYQGTLRFLVVMLHDYPEFLCRHYLSLIQLLPVDCIQLRNVVLSSFPKTMILPDPFTTSLGYMAANSTVPELYIKQDYSDIIALLDAYLTGSTKSVGRHIMKHLRNDQDQQLDNKKLQQLIFYVGSHTTLDIDKSLSENPAVQIIKYLLAHMEESKDRYLVINAIVDHLRYPNTHTYFFSMTLLHLFASQSEPIKELVTRVLLERLIVNRPHPWGLLTTFIQLIKEPMFTEYEFIKESMTHSPDIKRLFDNVLK
ncbi:chaperone ATPase hsp78 [Mucor velutinosus]|uniref:Chaperone ATPase hsp78 n=1 Tax=Mucor velutinosus TaxID=708070 RepID=A0AAN7DRW6_9FUNG|nr:chaperone ATPase hsp78 [Mucor velutinosus]